MVAYNMLSQRWHSHADAARTLAVTCMLTDGGSNEPALFAKTRRRKTRESMIIDTSPVMNCTMRRVRVGVTRLVQMMLLGGDAVGVCQGDLFSSDTGGDDVREERSERH